MNPQNIPLRKARQALDLTTAEAAQFVHVTRKTWEAWEALEAAGKPVPAASSELFFTKLNSIAHEKPGPLELVVVISYDPETNFQRPIDVVSAWNYLGRETTGEGDFIIKSLAIDRYTARPYVHKTKFTSAGNEHVLKFCERHTPVG